jgi:class 3 adenylate cyclase
MSSSRALVVARIGLGVASLVAGAAVSLAYGDLFSLLFFASYAIAGGLLVARLPGNIIGWLLLATGWGLCLASLTLRANAQDLMAGTASNADELIAWTSAWGWAAGFTSLLAVSILFPVGQLPSGRWRIPAAVLIAVGGVVTSLIAFAPTLGVTLPGDVEAQVPNPFAVLPEIGAWRLLPGGDVLILIMLAMLGSGAAGLLVRYRRSTGLERLQLRWLVAALALVTIGLVIGLLLVSAIDGAAWLLVAIAYPTVPAAIAIAVLRYRLYDVDLVINRTLVYGAATLMLALAFGIGNLAAQRLVQPLTGESSDLVTAGLAVAAAVAFTPVSRRLRPIADRLLPSRAVLTLFFTDIVESTRKAVELGDQAWRGLLERYRSIVRRELARFGGHEVDTAGDGFFATFEHPIPAVECALRVRAEVRRLELESRMGLHLGECEIRGEKVTGIAVHAAARVMSAAAAGEIFISDALRSALPADRFRTTDQGSHDLKGVPGKWQLFGIEES